MQSAATDCMGARAELMAKVEADKAMYHAHTLVAGIALWGSVLNTQQVMGEGAQVPPAIATVE